MYGPMVRREDSGMMEEEDLFERAIRLRGLGACSKAVEFDACSKANQLLVI